MFTRQTTYGVLLAAMLLSNGCDFEVTNPGPVQDVNLGDPAAHPPIVTGAIRSTLNGWGDVALSGGALVRDFHAGGHTGWAGVPERIEIGQLDDQNTNGGGWDNLHRGRWIAEYAVSLFTEVMAAEAESYQPLGRAYLWAGFANRMLGENYCTAVFDGGPPQDKLEYFRRAVEHFDNAERIAANAGDAVTETAAIAGRAQSHVFLEDWASAAADAARVPLDFKFQRQLTNRGTDEFSWLVEASTLQFKSLTFYYHPFETYFPATGDPRAAWGFDPEVQADVDRPTWEARLPMYYAIKHYYPRAAPEVMIHEFNTDETAQHEHAQDIADGREMMLIRAEEALLRGQLGEAVGYMNQVRAITNTYEADLSMPPFNGGVFTGTPLPDLNPATLDEAWAALKFERLLELNLEGRRLGDRWRWREYDTPGELHPLEYIPEHHVQKYGVPADPATLCFPLPRSENDRNPNVPSDFVDWNS